MKWNLVQTKVRLRDTKNGLDRRDCCKTYSVSLVALSVALAGCAAVAIDVPLSPIFGVGLVNAMHFVSFQLNAHIFKEIDGEQLPAECMTFTGEWFGLGRLCFEIFMSMVLHIHLDHAALLAQLRRQLTIGRLIEKQTMYMSAFGPTKRPFDSAYPLVMYSRNSRFFWSSYKRSSLSFMVKPWRHKRRTIGSPLSRDADADASARRTWSSLVWPKR